MSLAFFGDRAHAGACVDRLGSPDQSDVAIDPSTGAWCLDGLPINAGSRAEGLAMNVRAINAIVDDLNPDTADRWDYPGGLVNGVWDDGVGSGAERNTAEFIAALPAWAAQGVDLVTVGLQGGHLRFQCLDASGSGQRNFSAFTSEGVLRDASKARLQAVVAAARQHGIIVNVQFFYQNQESGLASDEAVIAATADAATFLRGLGADNVVVEIANETSDSNYFLTTLEPAGIPARIDEVHAIWPEALVSVSTAGGSYPPPAIAEKVDWVSFHGNGLSAETLTNRVTRAKGDPLLLGAPVVVTEDHGGMVTISRRRCSRRSRTRTS